MKQSLGVERGNKEGGVERENLTGGGKGHEEKVLA